MDIMTWTYIFVGLTFALYIGIAVWARAASTKEFYVAGSGVSPLANGLATAADWMSAASFLGMAGAISFAGRDGAGYLMGWTGGYVLLALLLAPYLRKFGQFSVPDFVGTRYYSQVARVVAVICAIFVSFTYVAGQMRGVGIVFSRFLEVDINIGVIIGMGIVFFYAVLGGMKGITYTQVAQYCVLIFAFMVPAFFISFKMTGNPIPQLGLGGTLVEEPGTYLLDKLDGLSKELGFKEYTAGGRSTLDMFCFTAALMFGTAGLPHVIIRFFTVPKVRDARKSAGYALLFIAILYTAAPAVAVFARVQLIDPNSENSVVNKTYEEAAPWFKTWETSSVVAWTDKNGDGKMTYAPGTPFADNKGKPSYKFDENGEVMRGENGVRLLSNKLTDNKNEVYIDKDIMVLANPEMNSLPPWITALVAAGGLAAALSTAAGLLLVISVSVSHDLMKKTFKPNITEKQELLYARLAAAVAVVIAGLFGIYPPGFVAQVVAFAFGLAAASFFPAIILGIFSKRVNREGAIAGMIVGLIFTMTYIVYFKWISEDPKAGYWWGITPEGIGTLGMLVNMAVTLTITYLTPAPPEEVQQMVEEIRIPKGSGAAQDH